MPNISASDYTTFIKYQAASLGYQNGAIPANRHNNVQIAPTQSIMNAQLLASKASYLTQTQTSSSVTVPDTFSIFNNGGSIYSSSTDPPVFSAFSSTGVAGSILVSYNGTAFCTGENYSIDNAKTWQSSGFSISGTKYAILWSTGLNAWIICGNFTGGNPVYVLQNITPSGTWVGLSGSTVFGGDTTCNSGACNGNIVVLSTYTVSSQHLYYSKTGNISLWTALGSFPLYSSSYYPFFVACNGDSGTWIAVGKGTSSTIARVTSNGVDGTWTSTTSGTNGFTVGRSICTNGSGRWVAGGTGGTYNISYSTDDGQTWTAVTSPFDGTTDSGASNFNRGVLSICWNGAEFVASGFNSSITATTAYSKDGITWYNISSGTVTSNPIATHLVLPYTAAKNAALTTTTAGTTASSVITGLNYVRPFAGKGYVNNPKSLSTVTYAGSGTTSSSKTYQAGGPPSGKGNAGKVITLYNGRS